MMSMPARQEGIPSLFVSGIFQVFTLGLLFIALIYRQQGLVLLALLILIMFNGARLWCRISMAGLHSRLALERERVFPGESLLLEAEVTNNKYLPVWLQLAVTVDRALLSPASLSPSPFPPLYPYPADTPVSSGEYDAPIVLTKDVLRGEGGLLWQQQACWRWELTAQRRGIYDVGPTRLAVGDLFGFYHQEKKISQVHDVIVYPRLVNLNDTTVPLRELFGSPGVKSPVVDPVYPVATRDYQEGQPARHINWKASARHGRLHEKVFQASAQQKILLAVDVEQFNKEKVADTFERTLEVTASLAVKLEQQGRIFGLVSNGILEGEKDLPAYLPPRRGTGQMPHLLEMLARLQMIPGNGMETNLLHGAGFSRGVTCLYFTYNSIEIPVPVQNLFNRFHIPIIFVVGKAPSENNSQKSSRHNPAAYPLEALLAEEEVAEA